MNAFSQWLSETCHHEPMNRQKRCFFPPEFCKGGGLTTNINKTFEFETLGKLDASNVFFEKGDVFFFDLFAGVHLWAR